MEGSEQIVSRTIDEKVVEMRFDNRNFEHNVATSMSTLDKLQQKLKFGDSAKGFEDLEDASKKVKFVSFANGVVQVTQKFSLMYETAKRVFDKVSVGFEQLFGKLTQFSNLSIVSAGLTKYEEKTKSVQTIMAATGENIETVNEQLEKLNWFTDETSYNFTDMVSNIGKFTAAGIDLNTATAAMQGIANWAAISGAGISEASRAMYNLSQAIGMGSVQLMDWKSIENANMGTKQFKEMALEAGVLNGELVRLKDSEDGIAQYALKKDTRNGKLIGGREAITYKNFRNSLSDKWLTNDVLTNVLQQYGGYASAVKGVQDSLNLDSASEAMRKIERSMSKISGEKTQADFQQIADELNITVEEAEALVGMYESVGREAFKAAQEAKTWSDVVDATKDAVGSKWMNVFESIFGDYQDAKKLWTDVAEEFYDIFAAPVERVGNLLSGALYHKESWQEMIGLLEEGGISAEDFEKKLISANKDFSVSLDDGEYSLEELIEKYGSLERVTERGLIPAQMLVDAFDELGVESSDAYNQISKVVTKGGRIELLEGISALYNAFKGSNEEGAEVAGILNTIGKAFREVFPEKTAEDLKKLIDRFYEFATSFSFSDELIQNVFDIAKATFNVFKVGFNLISVGFDVVKKIAGPILSKGIEILAEISRWINDIVENLDFSKITEFFDGLKDRFSPLANVFKNTKDAWAEFFGKFVDDLNQNDGFLSTLLGVLSKIIDKIVEIVKVIGDSLSGIFKSTSLTDIGTTINTGLFGTLLYKLNGIIGNISDAIGNLSKAMKQSIKADTIKKVSISIAILAGSLLLLSMIDGEKLATATTAMAVMIAELGWALKKFDGIKLDKKINKKITSIILLSFGLLVASSAMKKVAGLDWSGLVKAVVGIGAIVLELSYASEHIKGVDSKGLISLSVSLLVIAGVMKIIGKMEWSSLIKSVLGMGAIFIELGLASKYIKGVDSKGFIALSVSLLLLSAVMKIIGKMSWGDIAKGLVSIAASMLIFVLAMNTMKPAKGAGAAMLAMAASILLLVPAMAAFGKMKPLTIVKGLLAMAGAFAIFALAGYLLRGTELTLLAVSGAMALFGIGVLTASAGLIAFTTAVSVGGTEIAAGLYLILSSLISLIPMLVTGIASGIIAFVNAIGDGASSIIGAVVKIGKAILEAIRELIPDLVETVLYVVEMLLQSLNDHLPVIVNRLFDLLVTAINTFADLLVNRSSDVLDAIGRVIQGIGIFVLSAIQGLLKDVPVIGDLINDGIETLKDGIKSSMGYEEGTETGEEFGTGIADGVAEGLESSESETEVVEASSDLTGLVEDEISKLTDTMKDVGVDTAKGYAEGLSSSESKKNVNVSASSLGKYAKDALKQYLDSHSPSKVFMRIGNDTGAGFAIGISDSISAVEKSAKELGSGSVDAINESIRSISDAISVSDDVQPVIRPVVDLSDVTQSAGSINSMFNRAYGVNLLSASTSRGLSNSINIQNGNSNVALAIAGLKEDLNNIKNEIGGMAIVMDSGAVVGSISSKMDQALGVISSYKGRGN